MVTLATSAIALLGCALLAAAQYQVFPGQENLGILPNGLPVNLGGLGLGGVGPGSFGQVGLGQGGLGQGQGQDLGQTGIDPEVRPSLQRLVTEAFPNGVPPEVMALLAQGGPEANRQALEIVQQARRQQRGLGGARRGRGQRRGRGRGRGRRQGRLGRRVEKLVARAYPEGVPADVASLLLQGTPQAQRQVMAMARQKLSLTRGQGLGGLGRGNLGNLGGLGQGGANIFGGLTGPGSVMGGLFG